MLIGLWLCLGLSIDVRRELNTTEHYILRMEPDDVVELVVGAPGMTVVLPKRNGVIVDVYHKVSDTDVVVGSLTQTSAAFGVYFAKDGWLSLTATDEVEVPIFTFATLNECRRFFVSTNAKYVFKASKKDTSNSNLTIYHSQRACIFHVGDVEISLSVTYNTEPDYDVLRVLMPGSEEVVLYGNGTFYRKGKGPARFVWITDQNIFSDEFSIEIVSESTYPSYSANFSIDMSLTPLIIKDASPPISDSQRFEGEGHELYVMRRQIRRMLCICAFGICGVAIVIVIVLISHPRQRGEPIHNFAEERAASFNGDFLDVIGFAGDDSS